MYKDKKSGHKTPIIIQRQENVSHSLFHHVACLNVCSTLTMEELLNQLVKKVRIECEESHRQLVFALNGLAALDIIQNNVSSF